jgi:hypothetical protein
MGFKKKTWNWWYDCVSHGIHWYLFSEIQLQVLSEASDLAAYHAQARSESRWGALLCELCAVVHVVRGDVGGELCGKPKHQHIYQHMLNVF